MMDRSGRRQRGFTLLELGVALFIIGILIGIGTPLYLRASDRAKDTEAKELLRNAVVIEELYHLDHGSFSEVAAELEPSERSISWNVAGDPPGSVRAGVDALDPSVAVCLFTFSASGRLFAVYRSSTETRFGEPAVVVICDTANVSGWSTEGW